ncbi:MAG TPA: hypothetical protein VFQ38_24175 [Longimicrobiales bacterium]|nr:hypothetical protein [Longimicrobiales bacterium]
MIATIVALVLAAPCTGAGAAPPALGAGAFAGTAPGTGPGAAAMGPSAAAPRGRAAATQEGQLLHAVLRATVDEDAASVEVQLDYTVRAPAGTTQVPLAVVLFPNASVAVAEATSPVGNVTVELAGEGERWTGVLRLAQPLAASGELPFQLRYRVFQRGGPRVEVPVVAVLWRPAEPRSATFTGDVLAPAGLALYEPFPSGLEPALEESGQQRYHVELPAVPALLAFSVASGSAPWLTLGNVLNGAAVVLALAFSAAGWRYLRRRPMS